MQKILIPAIRMRSFVFIRTPPESRILRAKLFIRHTCSRHVATGLADLIVLEADEFHQVQAGAQQLLGTTAPVQTPFSGKAGWGNTKTG